MLPYVPFQENALAYCMNEWTNDLKKDIKLDGGNVGIKLNWNKDCGV